MTWKITITNASGTQVQTERHSTLLGQFMGAEELRRDRTEPVGPTPVGRLVARALALAESGRPIEDIMAELRGSSESEWTKKLESDVRDSLRKFTRPIA